MIELYSYETYLGYHLFVEAFEDEEDGIITYEGVAQHNGTTIYNSKSLISGDSAERKLKVLIDNKQGETNEL